ncbi:hypothetical protein GGS20DRAFT_516590 [Poronia punctata]|nr:hypothetical protein GGS20DRAFT_516590 [Poronia punctata]
MSNYYQYTVGASLARVNETAGGRGSIPRSRDVFFFSFLLFNFCVLSLSFSYLCYAVVYIHISAFFQSLFLCYGKRKVDMMPYVPCRHART